MRRWHYTNDVHDYVIIGKIRFKLNTSYDNIFKLFRAMKDDEIKSKIEIFLKIVFYKQDHDRLRMLIKDWSELDLFDLVDHINKNVLFIEATESKKRKFADIDMDSELIFASFYYDYKISLIEKKGKMTWKEFLILFENLSDDSPFKKAVRLLKMPLKDLTAEGRAARSERLLLLSDNGKNLNDQIDSLASFLKRTAKEKK